MDTDIVAWMMLLIHDGKFFAQAAQTGESDLEFFVRIFEDAGDLIQWTGNYDRWTLLAAGCLFAGLMYFVNRSPRH